MHFGDTLSKREKSAIFTLKWELTLQAPFPQMFDAITILIHSHYIDSSENKQTNKHTTTTTTTKTLSRWAQQNPAGFGCVQIRASLLWVSKTSQGAHPVQSWCVCPVKPQPEGPQGVGRGGRSKSTLGSRQCFQHACSGSGLWKGALKSHTASADERHSVKQIALVTLLARKKSKLPLSLYKKNIYILFIRISRWCFFFPF